MAKHDDVRGLKKKTVAELRDLAKGLSHEAVQGYTQMNKEDLLRRSARRSALMPEPTITSNLASTSRRSESG